MTQKTSTDTDHKFLPFAPPDITPEEIDEVLDTLQSGWITTGPKTKRFEQEFKEYIGVEHALALNSCTAGLHLALVALEIGPGDEVITTPMTFSSSVNVIEHVGARPVLVDVEEDTLTLDPAQVAKAITPQTKAIMPVHYAGHPVDLAPIQALAREHNLYIIEDAAHSLPAAYEGQPIGTIGDCTAFSFYATKNLTTAEGGMLVGSKEIIDRARVLSLHGMDKDAWNRYDEGGKWYYEVIAPGFKYNMTDIQASLGLVQLKRLEAMQERRRAVVARYHAAFSLYSEIILPVERSNVEHAWHLYVIRLQPDQLTIDRKQFIEELADRRIGASVHFIPIHLHPYYQDKYGWQPEDFPVAFRAYRQMLSLPLHPGLEEDDLNTIIGAVTEIIDTFRR